MTGRNSSSLFQLSNKTLRACSRGNAAFGYSGLLATAGSTKKVPSPGHKVPKKKDHVLFVGLVRLRLHFHTGSLFRMNQSKPE
jgi:hypothetical protein